MKLRPFELALVIIFIFLAMVALFLLATFSGRGGSDSEVAAVGNVTIWGTLPSEAMESLLRQLSENSDGYRTVEYRYYSANQFDQQLTNALADGRGPDIILVSHEKLVEMRRRIQPISYDNFPLRDIRSSYVDGAEIFAMSDGMYALPVAVDPLMLYWNRNILSTEGFLEAPSTWEALVNDTFPAVIQRDFNRSIQRAVVALGEYDNVRNSFGVMSLLLLQSGSQMVSERQNNEYAIQLQTAVNGGVDPLRSTADFYTRFSQPSNTLYSWNRAFSEDRLEFVAEDLALYFGYASEGPIIERMNPNLNFDIAEVPQGAGASFRRTYGEFYGLSLLRASDNMSGALAIMEHLAAPAQTQVIADLVHMVPPYRMQVAAGSNDKYGRIAYRSAGVALGWLNPDRNQVDTIFSTMTADINENRRELSAAVSDVTGRLSDAY